MHNPEPDHEASDAKLLSVLHTFLARMPVVPGETPEQRREIFARYLAAYGFRSIDYVLGEIAPQRGPQPDALSTAVAHLLQRAESWARFRKRDPLSLPVGAVVLPINDALLALQKAHRAAQVADQQAYLCRSAWHLHDAMETLLTIHAHKLPPGEVTELYTEGARLVAQVSALVEQG